MQGKGKRVIYKGEEFASLAQLAKKLDIPYYRLQTTMKKKDISIEDAVKECNYDRRCHKVVVEGVEYDSLMQATVSYGANYATIKSRMRAGKTVDEAFQGLTIVSEKEKRRYYLHNTSTDKADAEFDSKTWGFVFNGTKKYLQHSKIL